MRKRKMKARVFAAILAMSMLTAFMSVMARAEIVDSGTCGKNVTWTLDDSGTLTISGTGNMDDYEDPDNRVDPDYKPVHISPWSSSIKKVIIENGVTSIGVHAFSWCSKLTSVTIPNSVTSIGDSAFYRCDSLTNITIPDSVTSIGYDAFSKCSELGSITIPDSVTSIGRGAFSYTAYYENPYNWRFGVLYIGNHLIEADAECLENINSNVIIKDGTKTIADSAFGGCGSLTSIPIPDSVKFIGNYAFRCCTGLMSVTIPDSVTSIGYDAFSKCSELGSITIPDSVTYIGYDAFSYTAYYNNSDNWQDGVLYIGNHLIEAKEDLAGSCTVKDGIKTIANGAFSGCTGLISVTIPLSVTSIGDDTFRNCGLLASITIPDGVTSIGVSAFDGCVSLTSITIPDSVTSIGDYAFDECFSLTSITIPPSVTSIGDYAFGGAALTSITIPSSVTSIGRGALDCYNLTDVYYSGTEEQWKTIAIDEGNNEPLTNATIHYNSIIPTPDPDPDEQTPTPVPMPTPNPDVVKTTVDTYEISEITPTDTGVVLTVETNEPVAGKQAVMVACYDENGIFIGLKQEQITSSDTVRNISVDIDKSKTKTVKAFIWNGISYMMPACLPQSIEL